MSAKKIVITGGMGYIGIPLQTRIALSEEEYQVTVIDSLKYSQGHLLKDSMSFFHDDVDNINEYGSLLRSADVIIPLAALVGAPLCEKYPEEAFRVNVKHIQDIIRHIRYVRPGPLIVFPTTNSGYGTQSGDEYCTEETPLEPISHYGRTKKEAEEVVLGYRNSVSLRLATVFGLSPRMRLDLMVNDFAFQACQNGKLEVFKPEYKRNFIHVNDVANCFLHVIENRDRVAPGVYNVGDPKLNMTKGELAKKICSYYGADLTFGEGEDPDKRNYVVSSDKIMSTGFKPIFTIETCLDEIRLMCQVLNSTGPHFQHRFLRSSRNF